jgi:hypothetical protein
VYAASSIYPLPQFSTLQLIALRSLPIDDENKNTKNKPNWWWWCCRMIFTDRFLVDGGQKREMPTTELYFDDCCRSTTAASTSRDGDPERIQYNDADETRRLASTATGYL